MGETNLQRDVRRRQRESRLAVAAEIRRVRLHENVSLRRLGQAVGVDPSHLARVESGARAASLDALVAAAAGLGHDVSVRLFPATGPRVRDHLQARMVEALLTALHPRWTARLEVAVYRPVHGVIDLVLQDRETGDLVAAEAHSALHAVERQLRWAGQKADALPSARGWPWSDRSEPPRIDRLLILRSCRALRELAATVPQTFATAYPASTAAAAEALTAGTTAWPGDAIMWVRLDGAATRLLHGSPREITPRFVNRSR
jgi:transcriptional regulator with XRE-family HTH domain